MGMWLNRKGFALNLKIEGIHSGPPVYPSYPALGLLHTAFLIKYIQDKTDHFYIYIKIPIQLLYFSVTPKDSAWQYCLHSQALLTRKDFKFQTHDPVKASKQEFGAALPEILR